MFSGALQLTDLNDFITPSQECIKPAPLIKTGKGGVVVVDDQGEYYETREGGEREKLEVAKITLNDCLACSGCITSAESILITQQSQDELYRIIEENKKHQLENNHDKVRTIVISISPQSKASLAAKYNLDLVTTSRKLKQFFQTLGIKHVLDTTLSRDFALLENQKEFVRRYKLKDSHRQLLPMLSSACPGWICYAEKTHGDYILPYISPVKSPQQITGSLVKDYMAERLKIRPDQLYHVTVMPCFDKKLEASRNDFFNDVYQTRDVDCVITSIEVVSMLEKEGVCLDNFHVKDLDEEALNSGMEEFFQHGLYRHDGSTSGGFSDHVFMYAAKELFSDSFRNLEYKTLRNQDFKEVILEKDGEIVLRFAIANGFRNIQNIVQKLKRGKSLYHFVEIMACPSGCINGGAQIRATEESPKELVAKMEQLYYSLPSLKPEDNDVIRELYRDWLGGEDSIKARKMLYTEYHAIEKITSGLLVKW